MATRKSWPLIWAWAWAWRVGLTAGLALGLTVGLVGLQAGPARAEETWRGDFETGDASQWTATLNTDTVAGAGLSIVEGPVVEGRHAARLEITGEEGHLWHGREDLNRVELGYTPPAEQVREGNTLYFGWSFFLPAALGDARHQIGYWESAGPYQQILSFEVHGQDIQFVTRLPENRVHWRGAGRATPGLWHRIALGIRWSKLPERGAVDVWFDGEQVVRGAPAQTLHSDIAHFVQLGLLRDRSPVRQAIVLDDARAGTAIEDVLPSQPHRSATASKGLR